MNPRLRRLQADFELIRDVFSGHPHVRVEPLGSRLPPETYRIEYRLRGLRLVGEQHTEVLLTDADIPSWLPGDALYDDRVFLPQNLPEGEYELQLGIVDRQTREPRVRLAIEGRNDDGWYPMGTITVEDGPYRIGVERDLDTP
jgi:hypothetical protein